MAGRLPSAEDLGVVRVQPSLGTAAYRGETGLEGAAARGVQQAAGEFGEVSQYLLKAQDENDRMAAEDALNKYRADLLKRQYDEKDGWQNQLGDAATNSENMKRHTEYMQTSRDQIGATLSVRAKRYFNPQAEASRMHAEAQFFGHVSTQRLQQEVKIFETGQQLIMDSVSRQPLGPAGDELMRSSIEEAGAKARAFALRRGFSPEEATALSNDVITRIVATRIDGALNADRPDEAKRIYTENEKLLGQKGRQLAGKVNDAYLDWKTHKLADAVTDKLIADVEKKNVDIPPGGAPEPTQPADPALRGVRHGVSSTDQFSTSTGGTSSSARQVSASSSRGIRNNNPGNLVKSGIAWGGKVTGNDARFETFDSPESGVRALATNLLAYQRMGLDTVEKVIGRWAPPSENDTGAYVKKVAAEIGVAPGAKLNLSDQATLVSITQAIIRHENGAQPYNAGLINAAVGAALSGRNGQRTFVNDSVTFQTSRVRDLQEELKTLDANITEAFKKEFGESNPKGLELARQRARSRLSAAIQAENGIQQGNLNEITTTIINKNIDNFRDLQREPGMADKLRTAGPYIQHITSLMNMVGHQKSGAGLKGDSEVYFGLTARVIRGEITKDTELLPFLMDPQQPGSRGINMEQLHSLQNQIARVTRPETRDHERQLHDITQIAAARMPQLASVRGVISTGVEGQDPGKAMMVEALKNWSIDSREALRKATPEQLTKLLDRTGPEFIGSIQRLQRAFDEVHERDKPVATRQILATPAEQKAAPVVKDNWKTDTTYLKLPPAVRTPEGWKGGWFRWKHDGKLHQKTPSVGGPGG